MRWLPIYPTHHMAVNFNDDALAHDGVSQPLRSICEDSRSITLSRADTTPAILFQALQGVQVGNVRSVELSSTIKCEVSHVSAVACIGRSRADRLGVREDCRRLCGMLAKTNQLSKTRGCYQPFPLQSLHRRSTRRKVDMSRTPPAATPRLWPVHHTIFGVDPCN